MKSNLYFRHDVYALDDGDVMALVYQYHEAGYGVFWAVVERLTAEQTHMMPLDVLAMQVSVKLMASKSAKVKEIIKACINLGLLMEQDGMVYNERVLRQCEQLERYSKTQSENVQKRWAKYQSNTTVVQPNNDGTEASQASAGESAKERAKELVAKYHEMCPSLPKVKFVTDARVKHAGTFIREFSVDAISEGFAKAEASDFLKHGQGTWKGASFDWLVNKTNFAKVLEGNYDNRGRGPSTVCNDAEVMSTGMNENGGFDL